MQQLQRRPGEHHQPRVTEGGHDLTGIAVPGACVQPHGRTDAVVQALHHPAADGDGGGSGRSDDGGDEAGGRGRAGGVGHPANLPHRTVEA